MTEPTPSYLTTPIAETKQTKIPKGGVCVSGYSKLAGAPTATLIRLAGEKIFRRVRVWCFSNTYTSFVMVAGKALIVRDIW